MSVSTFSSLSGTYVGSFCVHHNKTKNKQVFIVLYWMGHEWMHIYTGLEYMLTGLTLQYLQLYSVSNCFHVSVWIWKKYLQKYSSECWYVWYVFYSTISSVLQNMDSYIFLWGAGSNLWPTNFFLKNHQLHNRNILYLYISKLLHSIPLFTSRKKHSIYPSNPAPLPTNV